MAASWQSRLLCAAGRLTAMIALQLRIALHRHRDAMLPNSYCIASSRCNLRVAALSRADLRTFVCAGNQACGATHGHSVCDAGPRLWRRLARHHVRCHVGQLGPRPRRVSTGLARIQNELCGDHGKVWERVKACSMEHAPCQAIISASLQAIDDAVSARVAQARACFALHKMFFKMTGWLRWSTAGR